MYQYFNQISLFEKKKNLSKILLFLYEKFKREGRKKVQAKNVWSWKKYNCKDELDCTVIAGGGHHGRFMLKLRFPVFSSMAKDQGLSFLPFWPFLFHVSKISIITTSYIITWFLVFNWHDILMSRRAPLKGTKSNSMPIQSSIAPEVSW